jgi:hypothetical protein
MVGSACTNNNAESNASDENNIRTSSIKPAKKAVAVVISR